MEKIVLSWGARVVLAFGLSSTVLASSSLAAEFYGVIDNFGRKARNAYVDVSIDTASGSSAADVAVFNVFGGYLAQFTILTNSRGFASTRSYGNLFDLSGGQPILVRVRTPPSMPSAATLHIDSLSAPMTIGIWPTNEPDGTALAMGKEFGIALGTFQSASLLIVNVGGTEQVADISIGTRAADGSGTFSNPRLAPEATWKVNLTQSQASSNLIVTSTGPIIVQVVIDDGKSIQSFMVLPNVG